MIFHTHYFFFRQINFTNFYFFQADSGTGSSVASSDTSASNEFLQGSTGLTPSTNPTRIIHLHHSFSHHHKILNSPTHSPPPPVQNFKRTSQVMLDLDDLPPLPQHHHLQFPVPHWIIQLHYMILRQKLGIMLMSMMIRQKWLLNPKQDNLGFLGFSNLKCLMLPWLFIIFSILKSQGSWVTLEIGYSL